MRGGGRAGGDREELHFVLFFAMHTHTHPATRWCCNCAHGIAAPALCGRRASASKIAQRPRRGLLRALDGGSPQCPKTPNPPNPLSAAARRRSAPPPGCKRPGGSAGTQQSLSARPPAALSPPPVGPRAAAVKHCGRGGDPGAQCTATPRCAAPCGRLRPLWDEARAAALSARPGVARALALGTVLAVELGAAAPAAGGGSGGAAAAATGRGGGYGSAGGAAHVVAALRAAGVQARPLGSVVYLMVTPTTPPAVCDGLMGRLEAALDAAVAPAAGRGAAGSGAGAAREGPIV